MAERPKEPLTLYSPIDTTRVYETRDAGAIPARETTHDPLVTSDYA